MNYAKALRLIRAARNIDQQGLAEKTGLSKSLISKIEAEERDLTQATKERISKALQVPISLIELLALEAHSTKLSRNQLRDIANHLLQINSAI